MKDMLKEYMRVVRRIQDAIEGEDIDNIIPALSSVLGEVGAFSEMDKKRLVFFVVGSIDRIYQNHGGGCEHKGKPN